MGNFHNLRHETFHRRNPDLRPHALTSIGLHGLKNGDFKEEIIDQLVDQLRVFYPLSRYSYVYGVMMPTVLKWMVMSIFQLFNDEAEYYLQNGGENDQKIAMKGFYKQMSKLRIQPTLLVEKPSAWRISQLIDTPPLGQYSKCSTPNVQSS